VDESVTLSATRLYDVCNPTERGEWLDILIGLIQYLRSGSSKVGFLNNSVERNMLHKDQEEKDAVEDSVTDRDGGGEVVGGYTCLILRVDCRNCATSEV
jgi:hypothetical protein